MMSPQPYSAAAQDLGLKLPGPGEDLTAQLADQEKARKKKLLNNTDGTPAAFGDAAVGGAAMNLLGL